MSYEGVESSPAHSSGTVTLGEVRSPSDPISQTLSPRTPGHYTTDSSNHYEDVSPRRAAVTILETPITPRDRDRGTLDMATVEEGTPRKSFPKTPDSPSPATTWATGVSHSAYGGSPLTKKARRGRSPPPRNSHVERAKERARSPDPSNSPRAVRARNRARARHRPRSRTIGCARDFFKKGRRKLFSEREIEMERSPTTDIPSTRDEVEFPQQVGTSVVKDGCGWKFLLNAASAKLWNWEVTCDRWLKKSEPTLLWEKLQKKREKDRLEWEKERKKERQEWKKQRVQSKTGPERSSFPSQFGL